VESIAKLGFSKLFILLSFFIEDNKEGSVSGELLFSVREWVIFAALIGLILSATEFGFQLGRPARSSIDEPARSEHSTI
jgi:hypothetical protein